MYIIGIDPGIKNIGISLLENNNQIVNLVYISRITSQHTLPLAIIELLKKYHISRTNCVVVIECQKHISKLITMVSYLKGYLDACKIIHVSVQPPSHGLHIKTYKERKNYSIQNCLDLINNNEIKCSDELYNELISDTRIHDISDSINMAYKYLMKYTNSNII